MPRSPSGPRWRAGGGSGEGTWRVRPRPRPRDARGPRHDADRGPRRDRKLEEETSGLPADTLVGSGGQPVDLALDPLEGPAVVARGGYGAMAMIAVGDPARSRLPQMYVRKMAVGPVARGCIDLAKPIAGQRAAIADAFGRNPNDLTRSCSTGAITICSRSCAVGCTDQAHSGRRRDGRDHRLDSRHERPPRSIGGARQAVIAAAALRVSAASSRRSSGRSPAVRSHRRANTVSRT